MGSKTNVDLMRSLVKKPAVAPKIAPKAVPLAEDKRDGGAAESLELSLTEPDGETTEFRVGASRIRDGSREPTLETDLTALAARSTTEPSGDTPMPSPAPAVDGRKAHPNVMPRVAPSIPPVTAPPATGGQKGGMDKLVEDLTARMLPALAQELGKQLKPLQDQVNELRGRLDAFMKGEGDVPESFEMLNQELEELKAKVDKKADESALSAVDETVGQLGKSLGGVEKTANDAKSGVEKILSGDAVPASFEALNGEVEEAKGAVGSLKGEVGSLTTAAKKAWGENFESAEASRYTTDVTISRHFVDYLMEALDEARAEKVNELLGEFGEDYCKGILESFVKNPKYVSEQLAEIRGYRLVQLSSPEENENPTDAIDARGFVDSKTDVVVQNAQYILDSLNGATGDS